MYYPGVLETEKRYGDRKHRNNRNLLHRITGISFKASREDKGLTVDEMSAISNLTKQVIRRIESDDYADLAGLSFVRGYLKLYAKKGVNEAAVLEPFDLWKAEQSGDAKHKATKPAWMTNNRRQGPCKRR